MADVSKAQKLASARKKFKELKKEKKKNSRNETVESAPTSREQTPVESVTQVQNADQAPLPNYFDLPINEVYQQPAAFFDNFTQNSNATGSFFQNQEPGLVLDNCIKAEVPEAVKNEPPEPEESSAEVANFTAFDTVKYEPQEQVNDNFLPQLHGKIQELEFFLGQEQQKNEELCRALQERDLKITELDNLKERQSFEEMNALREQLKYHMQTVEILVAEKTELVTNLNEFQLSAQQKTAECEELQGRLKTSRSRVADLEREVALLRNEKSQFDNVGREQNNEFEKLKISYQQLREEKEELNQDLLEAREKLKNSSENCLIFQQQIAELSNQLSLANIKIQQLTTGEIDQVSAQVQQLTQEKVNLEKQLSELTNSVKTLTKERDESNLQYQQYAQQLNAQLTNMAARLEKLQKENETLQVQEQNRIKHIGDLEKQLHEGGGWKTSESKAELETALQLAENLKLEIKELHDSNDQLLSEKEGLLSDLVGKTEHLKELESLLEQLRNTQPDNAKLLAAMESDKVAASRAVAQNVELKKQMDSMQEVFMKTNDDKIELIEQLALEQQNNKELLEKLQKTEIHLQTLAEAIEIKDRELSHLRQSSLELDKQMLQAEQLTDRLRHYEAQDHSSQALQKELQEYKQAVVQMQEEIRNLQDKKVKENGVDQEDLLEKLQSLEIENKQLQTKISDASIDSNHNDHILDKEQAMKHLEEKFLKTMEDIANLTEEKQRLEHLVLQLQGETETIGEYVALYQHQRSLLKQKAIEKDQQLSQLANDRQQMKNKLEKLNELVKKLVLEKGAVPEELLQQHDDLQNDNHLCEEHAKLHSEINKIAQSSPPVNENGTATAEQIIALLSEIKSSNLVQPTENFHHCPWCSGNLITV